MNKPVNTNHTSSWPTYSQDEIDAVVRVLRSGKTNYWTGEEAKSFEKEYANHCGVQHAVAVANGSVGLELALKALGVGPGDEVVVPSRTFVATASSVVLCGATPRFADVDQNSQNITVETIGAAITARTRAIIAVHLAGWPCHLSPILKFAASKNIAVVEDCAQAHGALYDGKPVGSIGDVGVFSFCQDKIISTGGEGGMLVTKDRDIWNRAWSYKDHGKSYEAVTAPQPRNLLKFRWLHRSFGTNWRMTEMQAAIGRLQLRKLENWVRHRNNCATYLNTRLRSIPGVRTATPHGSTRHAYYKYYAFVEPERLKVGWNRDRVVETLLAKGFFAQTGICPEVYLETCFQRTGLHPPARLPVAKELGTNSFLTLVDPTVSKESLAEWADALTDVMQEATLG